MPDLQERTREARRVADRVCSLIPSSDLPTVDVDIERSKVRAWRLELYPEPEQLNEIVYETRFRRSWDRSRDEDE